ncbi:MAG TPA: hypothetical protein VNL70_07675, partial [Tepidisphaeraceae bacterium]|nr:hypothetical protein [Tepidisphaeraceae bacterium]
MDDLEYYRQLVQSLRHIALLDSVGSLLGWDERTHLPPKGTNHRADQLGLIARLTHEQFTSPRIGELLAKVQNSRHFQAGSAEEDLVVNVRETLRLYERARKLPSELVEEMTRTAVLAEAAWVQARQKSEFALFEPWLVKTLELKRREAECVGYTSNPYDALLEVYEPHETAQGVQQVFDSFRQRLVELVGRVTSCGRKAPVQILHRRYPTALQERFARDAARAIGFDFEAGRLDVTVHPFCSGIGPGDTRLTTRYNENYFGDGFFSVLHEAGHGLYEQ